MERFKLKRLLFEEDGVTTVEYALLLALVSIAAITAWQTLGNRVKETVEEVNNTMGGIQQGE